jgi:large subunit ribosomal protein L3
MNAIIGRKLGMTRIYDDNGHVIPVTVVEAGPCPVVQIRTGPDAAAVQLGFGAKKAKRTSKAAAKHAAAAGLESAPATLQEFPVNAEDVSQLEPGTMVTVDVFAAGDRVKITGTTKGRGFQGVVKRHGFSGGPSTHGNTRYRRPGSLGPGTDPSRVIKGKKMPGQYGAVTHTEMGLRVVRVDVERNLLFIRGAVPGPTRGLITVRKQQGASRYA